ncbi:hypothetical protein GCM10010129_76570 [Streptomyces fumigatiscleroticus]|nr:hypothetical protein GCM10010129_76570 [Streptomyces fumigatiscleroticus]
MERILYGLEHYAEHLSEIGDVAELRELIAPAWLDRKRRYLGLDAYPSLSRDVILALAHRPNDAEELPAFLRLCVLAAMLNTIVTELPPESLAALAAAGRPSQALASVAMIAAPYERASAVQAIARGLTAEPGKAAELWQQSASLAVGLADDARAGRLLAASARGMHDLGATPTDLAAQAERRLASTATAGASSWLLVTEAYLDLAAVGTDPCRHLAAALRALHNVDRELDSDGNLLVRPLRAVTRAMAAAGDVPRLERLVENILSEDQPRPLFSRYGRKQIALAVIAVGMAEGGEPERARAVFTRAAELGSAHHMDQGLDTMLREQDFDDPTTWRSSQFNVVTRGLGASLRLEAEEAALLAWAGALILPEAGEHVQRLVHEAFRRLDRLDKEEQELLVRTRFGPTRLEALNLDDPLDPAAMQDEQERNLLVRCYATARLATALHHVGEAATASRLLDAAIAQTSRLTRGHGGVVEVLMELVASMRADPKTITTIVDTARLDWGRALDTALDGTLDFADLATRVAPARAAAGDSTGLRMIAARAPAGRTFDPARAQLAHELAKTGDTEAALALVRAVSRRHASRSLFRTAGGFLSYLSALAHTHSMRRSMGSGRAGRRGLKDAQRHSDRQDSARATAAAVQTWTSLADAYRLLGSARDSRGALRRAVRATRRFDDFFNPPKEVMPLYAAMIRPAVELGWMAALDRVLRRMAELGDPVLRIQSLAAAFDALGNREVTPAARRRPLSLPSEARALLREAVLTAFSDAEDWPRHVFVVTEMLEDLNDEAAVAEMAGLLAHLDTPATRLRECTARIRIGSQRAVDAALTLMRPPAEIPGALPELLAACLWIAPSLGPAQVRALRDLVEEQPDADTVAVLIELGLALPQGRPAQEVLADAARHSHRLRRERPELLASLARSGDDPVGMIAQGAVSAVTERGTVPSDRDPVAITAYLMTVAPAARELDPALPGRIWEQIHDLRTFRDDGPPVPTRPPPGSSATHTLSRILTAALWYPGFLALTWLAVGLMAHLAGGHRGPFRITAAAALMATAPRLRPRRTAWRGGNLFPFLGTPGLWISLGVHAVRYAAVMWPLPFRPSHDAPPPRSTFLSLEVLVLASQLLGAWCSAVGLTHHWSPRFFPATPVATACIFTLIAIPVTLNITRHAHRQWTGGNLPYAQDQLR